MATLGLHLKICKIVWKVIVRCILAASALLPAPSSTNEVLVGQLRTVFVGQNIYGGLLSYLI